MLGLAGLALLAVNEVTLFPSDDGCSFADLLGCLREARSRGESVPSALFRSRAVQLALWRALVRHPDIVVHTVRISARFIPPLGVC